MILIDEKYQRKIQQQGLNILFNNKGGFEFTPVFFPYVSGEIGNYYVHSEAVMQNGIDYQRAVRLVRDLVVVAKEFSGFPVEVITGGETRDWIFSNPVASLMGWPSAMIYKDGKMVGASLQGRTVTHIADVNNEGSSPRDYWMPAIKKAGGNPRDIFFFVDRGEDGTKVMQELELQSYSVVPLDSCAWDNLQHNGVVNTDVYRSLQERLESRKDWAHKMLRSEAGLRELRRLISDSRTQERGIKIINIGYPELKDELIEGLARIDVMIKDKIKDE